MRRLALLVVLAGLAAPAAWAAPEEETLRQRAMQWILESERISPPAGLQKPVFFEVENSTPARVVLSAAMGTETMHGIPYTWIFDVGVKELRPVAKFPFRAAAPVDASTSAIKGHYWIYDCYLCDNPEAGYFFSVPVVVRTKGGDRRLVADESIAEFAGIRLEAERVLESAVKKYQHAPAELLRIKREVPQLFRGGLSSAPLRAPARPARRAPRNR